jgi:hypothetical protein
MDSAHNAVFAIEYSVLASRALRLSIAAVICPGTAGPGPNSQLATSSKGTLKHPVY